VEKITISVVFYSFLTRDGFSLCVSYAKDGYYYKLLGGEHFTMMCSILSVNLDFLSG
jgi:hypothetical protein